MEPQFRAAGGALEQLGQLGLSELDLLKLAASGGLNTDVYTRSHSAEVARAQAAAQQPTFSPSWPPHGGSGTSERDAAAAAMLGARGMPPLSPGSYLGGGGSLGGGGGLDGSPLGAADLAYLAQLGAASAPGAGSSAAFGEGPRIYVGGVPDLVTVAMVRDHFSRWGVVRDVHFPKERTSRRRRHFCFVTFESMPAAERAVAESNREIGGYPVAAINIPTDRLTHYGLRQASALASPTASIRGGLPFGSPGGGLPSSLGMLGGGGHMGGDAYSASPTRAQSHSGAYNVTHQVGSHRIRGPASADFMATDAAAQLAAASEQDLAAALAALRMSQQQQVAAAAAANGYGSAGGSGASTRQTSHDFSSVATYSGTNSVGRGSHDYAGPPVNGGPQLGGAGGGGLNPAAGGDIYTVLANMQRNSAAAAQQQAAQQQQQQQQQRLSPQPAPHMNMLHGGSGRSSAGVTPLGTPLGTPPGEGFHMTSGGGSRPGSAFDAGHAPLQPQGNSYGFLGQGHQQPPMHQRSYSFEGSRSSLGPGSGQSQQQQQDVGSLRTHSAVYARSASPLARVSPLPEVRTSGQFAPGSPAVHGGAGGGGYPGDGGGYPDHGGLMVSAAFVAPGPPSPQQYGSLQGQNMAQPHAQLPVSASQLNRQAGDGQAINAAHHNIDFASGSGHGAGNLVGGAGGDGNNMNNNDGDDRNRGGGTDVSGLANSFAIAAPRSEAMLPQGARHGEVQPQPQPQPQPHHADSADADSSSSFDAKMHASVSDLLRGSSDGSGQPPQQPQQHAEHQPMQQQLQQQPAVSEWRRSWDSGVGGGPLPNGYGGDPVSSR